MGVNSNLYFIVISIVSKSFFVRLLTVVSAMAAAAEAVNLSGEEMAALNKISQGTNTFAIRLYRALASKETGNVFVSPLSVQMVLALAYTGSKGDTAKELVTLLSLPENMIDTYNGYHSLIKVLTNPVLKLANRMFVEKSAGLKENFQNGAAKYFTSVAEGLDFRTNYEKSRENINSWVQEKTENKIVNLLQPGTLNGDTRLVLVNAIHFKADWAKKFSEEDTKLEPFHVSSNKTVQVEMMHAKKKFRFAHDEELKAKILQLDYEGMAFRMLIILPDDIDGLSALEAKLETVNLTEKITYMGEPIVTVALPKFKMEQTMELNEILKTLGAKTMFDEKRADFSGISDAALVVSKVIQKAFVEVNEKGTEAAAATAGMIRLRRSLDIEEDFIADHPFSFVILESNKNSAIFIGRFILPNSINSPDRKVHGEL